MFIRASRRRLGRWWETTAGRGKAFWRQSRAVLAWARLSAWVGLALTCADQGAAEDGLTALVHMADVPSAHPPLIVLLHGVGADERDMVGLWHDIPKDFVVVSPRAPFADPGGGWRWYRKASRAADIAVSRKIVDLIVANAVKRFDADPRKIFLGGFSQGAVMTYEVALREPKAFRGAAVLSGSLFGSAFDDLKRMPAGDRAAVSVFIGHGKADRVIPFSAAHAAKTQLKTLGFDVAFHVYPGMRHETGAAEIRDFHAWLESLDAP